MLGRQWRQLPIRAAIELNEHQVPNLNDIRRARVDELAAAFVLRPVVVDLRAGAAGPGLTHFPEVILLVALVNMRRADVGLGPPIFGGLVIGTDAFLRAAFKYGHMQPALVELPYLRQQLPRPGDGFFLEVVAKGPVAEHLVK